MNTNSMKFRFMDESETLPLEVFSIIANEYARTDKHLNTMEVLISKLQQLKRFKELPGVVIYQDGEPNIWVDLSQVIGNGGDD